MFIAVLGMKHYAHFYTWSEALCSLLYMELCFKLIAIHGEMLYAQCYTRSIAICSMQYKE